MHVLLRALIALLGLSAAAPAAERGSEAQSYRIGPSPEEFLAYIKLELARWGKVIRDNNIRGE